jgi:hypothetical protein
VGGLFALAICWTVVMLILGIGGVMVPFPVTEISRQKPYVDYIGREYRVTSDVDALMWNDFPDKAKILSISLMPPPSVANRFVSFKKRLQPGQVVRVVGAQRQFDGFGFHREYVVLVPDAGLPGGIPVTIDTNSDGVLDPRVYEPISK